jgi:hypothetical protein
VGWREGTLEDLVVAVSLVPHSSKCRPIIDVEACRRAVASAIQRQERRLNPDVCWQGP